MNLSGANGHESAGLGHPPRANPAHLAAAAQVTVAPRSSLGSNDRLGNVLYLEVFFHNKAVLLGETLSLPPLPQKEPQGQLACSQFKLLLREMGRAWAARRGCYRLNCGPQSDMLKASPPLQVAHNATVFGNRSLQMSSVS